MNYLDIAKDVFDIEQAGLVAVKEQLDDNFVNCIEAIYQSEGRVIVTGMGKSGLVAKKIAATLASTGTSSFFIHPAEAYHGDLGMIRPNDIILALSYSGETDEVAKLLNFFQENKNPIIAMTGNPKSTLATHSTWHLNIGVPKEACPLALAPTTSTTVSLAMGDSLAVALMKKRDFKPENFAKFHPGGSLGRKLLTRVEDLMKTEDLPILSLEDGLDQAIGVISAGRFGVGVVLEKQKIAGVLTDGDIRRALEQYGPEAIRMKVSKLFTQNPLTINASEKIMIAEQLMQEKKVSVLVVVRDNEFCGLLHRYDL